jgi:two-component system phosphate regulon sensor histidine kinase PhoR
MEQKSSIQRIIEGQQGPRIAGAEVSVAEILTRAAEGLTEEEIVAAFPGLTPEDIRAAMAYAAQQMREMPQAPPQRSARPSGSSSTSNPALETNKILLVDDLKSNLRLMELMFKETEFEIVTASGEDAIATAREERPFLIITDVQMPEIDGFELARRLKSDEQLQHAGLIFLTAHHRSSDYVTKGLDLGGDDYLYRPFQREELLARVRAVTRLKQAETNARSQARLVKARNAELEMLNNLALIASASHDAQPGVLFRPALHKLTALLDAEAILLLRLDVTPGHIDARLVLANGDLLSALMPFQPAAEIDNDEALGLAIQEHAAQILTQVVEKTNATLATSQATVKTIPMASRNQLVGALVVVNKRSGHFSSSDWSLLTSASGLMTIAMENASLWQSVQQQVKDLKLLNQIGQTLTSTLDMEEILTETTETIRSALDTEAASIWLLDEDEERQVLRLTFSSAPDAQQVKGFELPLDEGIAGYVARTGEPYCSPNALQDDRHSDLIADVSDYQPGSILCVPLRSKRGIIGVIQALHSQPHRFHLHDLQLLQLMTNSVGIAVENAKLFAEVQTFNQQLERMVAERTAALVKEKEKSVAILAGMADGLIVFDAEERILTANAVAESMLGLNLAEQIGQRVSAECQTSPLWRRICDVAAGQEFDPGASIDLPDPTQEGNVLSIQTRASQIRTPDGRLIGTAIVLRDVTALKAIERMKARFMAGVTHELKTPLAVIKMHVKNLAHYYKRLSANQREQITGSMQRQVDLLEELIENILELSRLDAGEAQLEIAKLDLVPLVEQIVAEMNTLATAKGITLRWQKPPASRSTLVRADDKQLACVVRNLVDNAIKYTPEGGAIEVAIISERDEKSKPWVGVRVQDTGIGIPPEAQAHIFERFYRVDPSHTVPGTGLGLSIVKEIIEAHGGTITLESEPGKGSTFEIRLPGLSV